MKYIKLTNEEFDNETLWIRRENIDKNKKHE